MEENLCLDHLMGSLEWNLWLDSLNCTLWWEHVEET